MKGRVLIIAGSDSGGGAGIQADIKTVTALGGYAATAVTAITVQNTLGVHGVHAVPVDIIAGQITAVLDDIGADAVKTGMLHDVATVDAVCDVMEGRGLPLIIDPVMVAKGGASLLSHPAAQRLKDRLVPMAAVLTPNIPEAEALTGLSIKNEADMARAGDALLQLGAQAVLMKGGHAEGEEVVDLLISQAGVTRFAASRIHTRHTHGTGCTLASAIATGIAQGLPLIQAVERARDYVRLAISSAPGYGQGAGPLNHAHPCRGVYRGDKDDRGT